MRGWSCEALIASGRTRSRRDAARYGAGSAPNAVRLLDRSHSTHRGRGVLSLREVAAQLQLHVRQLTDAGCVFGKPNFTTKRLSVAPPNRDLGQSHSSLGVVGDLDRRRSDRHLQFWSRFTARTGFADQARCTVRPAMACRGVVTVALCKIALPGSRLRLMLPATFRRTQQAVSSSDPFLRPANSARKQAGAVAQQAGGDRALNSSKLRRGGGSSITGGSSGRGIGASGVVRTSTVGWPRPMPWFPAICSPTRRPAMSRRRSSG